MSSSADATLCPLRAWRQYREALLAAGRSFTSDDAAFPVVSAGRVSRPAESLPAAVWAQIFKRAARRAGLEGATPHSLRASGVTWLAEDGAGARQLKAMGRWRSRAYSAYVRPTLGLAATMARRLAAAALTE